MQPSAAAKDIVGVAHSVQHHSLRVESIISTQSYILHIDNIQIYIYIYDYMTICVHVYMTYLYPDEKG